MRYRSNFVTNGFGYRFHGQKMGFMAILKDGLAIAFLITGDEMVPYQEKL